MSDVSNTAFKDAHLPVENLDIKSKSLFQDNSKTPRNLDGKPNVASHFSSPNFGGQSAQKKSSKPSDQWKQQPQQQQVPIDFRQFIPVDIPKGAFGQDGKQNGEISSFQNPKKFGGQQPEQKLPDFTIMTKGFDPNV